MFRDFKYLAQRYFKALAACGHGDWLRCSFCKEWAPMLAFNKDPRSGFKAYHSACVAKYYRDRRNDHPEVKAREQARDRARGSGRPNRKQSIAAYNGSEKRKHGYRRYYQTTKGRENYRRVDLRRRARKVTMEGSHTPREWGAVLFINDYACVGCGRFDVRMTRDHIVPISKGGSDYIDNIQPMCQPCNSRKRDRMAA